MDNNGLSLKYLEKKFEKNPSAELGATICKIMKQANIITGFKFVHFLKCCCKLPFECMFVGVYFFTSSFSCFYKAIVDVY